MSIIHISAVRSACPWLEGKNITTLSGTPEEIIQTIDQSYPATHIFIIDLDDAVESADEFELFVHHNDETTLSQESSAVEPKASKGVGLRILKLLRLKGYLQHCILYSSQTREELLIADPRNSIIGSPGVTFVWLEQIPALDYDRLQRQLAPKDMTAYFLADAGSVATDDDFANSWGVWKLWEVQRAVEQITSQKTDEIERSFGKAYEQMNTYEGLLARYLKGNPYEDINKSLNEKMLLWGELLEQEHKVRQRYEAELHAMETLRSSLLEWEKEKDLPQDTLLSTRVVLQALETSTTRISGILAKCQAIKLEKNSISARKYSANLRLSKELNRLSENTFVGMRKQLLSRAPRIIYVDEHAQDGWAQILQRIIYGKAESEHFHILESLKDHQDLAEAIKRETLRVDADLLILDLGLQGDNDLASSVENASSMQILSELSDTLPCPILIVSTADRMRNYRELLSWGATAGWVKQSLSDRSDVEYTVGNYVTLVQSIHSLCFNESVDFCYREFLPMIQELEQAKVGSMWWECSYDWGTLSGFKHIRPERTQIFEILNTVYGQMRELIGSTIISGVGEQLNEVDNSLLVASLFQVLEKIYLVEALDKNEEKLPNLIERVKAISPELNTYKLHKGILSIRHKAIHSGQTSQADLFKFIGFTMDFLEGRDFFLSSSIVEDQRYTSVVSFMKPNGYGAQTLVFLATDEVKLEGNRTNITLIQDEVERCGYAISDIEEGIRLRHNIDIERNAKGAISYYARNIEIVESEDEEY